MKTPFEVAQIFEEHFAASDVVRARVSEVSLCRLAQVTKLNSIWISEFIAQCNCRGILIGELARGGFGVISTEALSGAKVFSLPGD